MSRSDPRQTNESKLARARVARGLTQAQLADMIGCTRVDVSRWERGTHAMGSRRIAQIARALECRIEDIIEVQE